jgi:hypothetical protein
LRPPAGLELDGREHDGRLVRVEIAGVPTLVLDGRQEACHCNKAT